MYSMRDRSLTQGYASIFTGLGMGLGGPLGGYISDKFGWRWAFLVQVPFFLTAFTFVTLNLNYATPGKGKNTREVLKRIDYYGCSTLLCAVGSCLFFLSLRYNQNLPLHSPTVLLSLVSSITFSIAFVLVELLVAPEPIMAPSLLRQRVPVLVGASNLVVAVCNFAVQYHFPMWFETVQGTNSTIAGLHLMPNSFAMSLGSVFAGYMMHRTGKYKLLNVTFGILPTIAALLIARLRTDSYLVTQWISIIPLGFGNAVVLQTTLIALLASIPHSQLAVGTGFTILFRGIGQVSGVAVASALFQNLLDRELRKRFKGEGSEELIMQIRHSYKVLNTLPEDQKLLARGAYAISLRYVFFFAAVATLTGFIIRLGIPELSLDKPNEDQSRVPIQTVNSPPISKDRISIDDDDLEDRGLHEVDSSEDEIDDDVFPTRKPVARKLSTYESENGFDPVILGRRRSSMAKSV
ncbi:hypothetical protein FRC03_006753 [Tulasnella sp. 419]|nr:hypothetical protein FRC03_006753 [Tulasnella sp. 419]